MKASARRAVLAAVVAAISAGRVAFAVESVSSAPQGVTLSVYDTGMALVQELRRVTLAAGENTVRFGQLPAELDPATVSVSSPSGGGFKVLEQRFEHALASTRAMLTHFVGQPVEVETAKGVENGVLLGVPSEPREAWESAPLVLGRQDGSPVLFPDLAGVLGVKFPAGAGAMPLEPSFVWRIESKDEGPQNLRLTYAASGLSWRATHELIMDEEGTLGYLTIRVAVENRSGGRFENARLRLISTELGADAVAARREQDILAQPETGPGAMRYSYGRENLTFERWANGLAPLGTYELPQPLTLAHGDTKHVELRRSEKLPVSRFHVYDGVKFDRFQRNRRNDWNYGTESHHVVETHIEFSNSDRHGLGFDLPPGRFRLYQQQRDGAVDLLGEDVLKASPPDSLVHVRLGPARGLLGERERTGYSEVVPLHEYEETFEIRLENSSSGEAEIRVVEHLYRWQEYEIVKADTEYTQAAPQTIVFRPLLKPGGKRSIHYTVRYRW